MWRRSAYYSIGSFFPSASTRRIPSVLPRSARTPSRCPTLLLIRSFATKKEGSHIQARPPGEKDFESKFPLPDKEKELELSTIQIEVQDLYKAGNYRRALKSSETLLQSTQEHFGRDHPVTASAYNNVGLMYKHLGDFDNSRKHYQAALKIYKVTVGTDHASYASILHNLGTLNRSQIHFDDSLRATDRLSLVEQSVEYLEEAYRIRLDEMGAQHPHTVASRSGWGATLSAQILHHYKMTTTTTNDPSKRKTYVSLLPKQVSEQGWDAAEQHLRQALQTAVENPRGPSIQKKKQRGGKKQKQPPNDNNKVQTLSAASAAQNLAVFLKARATTESPYNEKRLQEAHDLYQQVLDVRSQLLPAGHPDLYATKHSQAELLEAMGDEAAANALRQEIVDTYDAPPEENKEKVKVDQQSQAKEEDVN